MSRAKTPSRAAAGSAQDSAANASAASADTANTTNASATASPPKGPGILSAKSPKAFRGIMLTILPDIQALIDDFLGMDALRIAAGPEATQAQQMEAGITFIKNIIHSAMSAQYDRIIRILAAVYDTTPEAIEDEKTMRDVVGMVLDVVGDPVMMAFFPKAALLARRMRLGT